MKVRLAILLICNVVVIGMSILITYQSRKATDQINRLLAVNESLVERNKRLSTFIADYCGGKEI